MGSRMHRALRTLCLNNRWSYAVFWRLQHQTPMVLTYEDAYYNDMEHPERQQHINGIQDGHCSSDPLLLAIGKMSYNVYSLGEGIVGQVVVSGKHLWVSADAYALNPHILFENWDGYQSQFAAGIKTIAVVAVVPYGVVQLGSLDRIAEDITMVNQVRNVFFCIQDTAGGPSSNRTGHPCLSHMCPETSSSGNYLDPTQNLGACIQNEKTNFQLPTLVSQGTPDYNFPFYPISGGNVDIKTVKINTDQSSGNTPVTSLECGNLDHKQKKEGLVEGYLNKAKESCLENIGHRGSTYNASPADYSLMDVSYSPSDLSACGLSDGQNIALSVPKRTVNQLHKDDLSDYMDKMGMSSRVCAGYELYEVLGAAFQSQNIQNCLDVKWTSTDVEMPEEGVRNFSGEHTLEAMVAKVGQKDRDTLCDISCKKSIESLITIENMTEPCSSDVGTVSSAGYSFDRDSLNTINSSGTYSIHSSKGVSSTSSSKVSGLLDRSQESTKTPKKRARPGESCRPRPRDRQLIQDRIKELRELVPNGSKCSIDSLLEKTVKHMLFMQSITKHADKLKKCAALKVQDKEVRFPHSSCNEQGSSWAVEVGSNREVCPIMVENMDMNGLLLVEMSCDSSSHFLEVAEAIRNMGLTILKGVTEAYGEKTWMRLVVEAKLPISSSTGREQQKRAPNGCAMVSDETIATSSE
ncbi:hypothetical protein Leryth_016266 [Lithospermum erythrorhizon]|nr:hypothetical protein Leryth_016266 [Lithospermum erythrorhizon]